MSEWIDYAGEGRPVPPETRVEVRHRSGEVSASYMDSPRYKGDNRACTWGWNHSGDPGDIVAYRVLPAPPSKD